jgi:hypothetical protein
MAQGKRLAVAEQKVNLFPSERLPIWEISPRPLQIELCLLIKDIVVIEPIDVESYSKDGDHRGRLPFSRLQETQQQGSYCAKTILPQPAPTL